MVLKPVRESRRKKSISRHTETDSALVNLQFKRISSPDFAPLVQAFPSAGRRVDNLVVLSTSFDCNLSDEESP